MSYMRGISRVLKRVAKLAFAPNQNQNKTCWYAIPSVEQKKSFEVFQWYKIEIINF